MKVASFIAHTAAVSAFSIPFDTASTPETEKWEVITESNDLGNIDTVNVTKLLLPRDDICTDPSFGTSQWANYGNDGNGRYLGSCGDSGHNSNKCWTDVYAVQAQTLWTPWDVVSGGVDCAGSAGCSISDINAIQTCKSQSTSVSVSVGLQSDILSLGAEVTHTDGTMDCQTHTSQKTWTW
jgi:hypothetical protein